MSRADSSASPDLRPQGRAERALGHRARLQKLPVSWWRQNQNRDVENAYANTALCPLCNTAAARELHVAGALGALNSPWMYTKGVQLTPCGREKLRLRMSHSLSLRSHNRHQIPKLLLHTARTQHLDRTGGAGPFLSAGSCLLVGRTFSLRSLGLQRDPRARFPPSCVTQSPESSLTLRGRSGDVATLSFCPQRMQVWGLG